MSETNLDLAAFTASLEAAEPPPDLTPAAAALWWDGHGDWARAHECAQEGEDAASAWVHAYLHRKEGDLANAGYWYRRAGKPVATAPLAEEWRSIAAAMLAE